MCVPIIGAIVSGIGAAMQVSQAQQQAEMQAKLYEREATYKEYEGAYAADRKAEEVARVIGQQSANFAAAGVSGGSVVDTQVDSQTEGNLDIAAIRWNADEASKTSKFKAKMERAAKPSGFAVASAFISPVIKAIPTS